MILYQCVDAFLRRWMPFGGRNRDPCPFHSLQKIGFENLVAKAIGTQSWAELHPTVCRFRLGNWLDAVNWTAGKTWILAFLFIHCSMYEADHWHKTHAAGWPQSHRPKYTKTFAETWGLGNWVFNECVKAHAPCGDEIALGYELWPMPVLFSVLWAKQLERNLGPIYVLQCAASVWEAWWLTWCYELDRCKILITHLCKNKCGPRSWSLASLKSLQLILCTITFSQIWCSYLCTARYSHCQSEMDSTSIRFFFC